MSLQAFLCLEAHTSSHVCIVLLANFERTDGRGRRLRAGCYCASATMYLSKEPFCIHAHIAPFASAASAAGRINGKLSLQPSLPTADSHSPLCSPIPVFPFEPYSLDPRLTSPRASLAPLAFRGSNKRRPTDLTDVPRFLPSAWNPGSGNVPIAVFAAAERKGRERSGIERRGKSKLFGNPFSSAPGDSLRLPGCKFA